MPTPKQLGYLGLLGALFSFTAFVLQRDVSEQPASSRDPMRARALLTTLTSVLSAIGMEYYARYAHGTLWHGRWWSIHATHHTRKSERDTFERNDVFSLANVVAIVPAMAWASFAPPSLPRAALLGFTVGASAFGTAYMVIHDGVAHRRFPTGPLRRVPWIRRVADAHAEHHKGAMAAPYGLFLGPAELAAKAAGRAPAPAPRCLCCGLVVSAAYTLAGLSWELCSAVV